MDDSHEIEQSIVVTPSQTLLSQWGSRVELREMSDRLRRTYRVTLKGGDSRQMTPTESDMLATVVLAYGLNPLVGEVYLMLDKQGHPKIVTGYTAYEKAGNAQMQQAGGGTLDPKFEPISDPDERAALLIPAGAVAIRCKLYDTITKREYVEMAKGLASAGAKWDDIERIIGGQPYTEGIGIYLPNNNTRYQDEQWSPALRARKRAYNAALKARFNLNFTGASDGDLPEEFKGRLLQEPTTPNDASATAPASGVVIDQQPPAPEPPPVADPFDNPGQPRETVTPIEAAAAESARARATAPAPDYAPNSPIWKTWRELVTQANALRVPVPALDAAASNEDVASAATDLRKLIKAAQKKGNQAMYGEDNVTASPQGDY